MMKYTTLQQIGGQILRVQIIVRLFLFFLCVAGAISAPAQGVIDFSSTSGTDLDSLFGLPTNSVSIIAGVTIDNTAGETNAVYGDSRFWTLTNAASVNGANNGVDFEAGGSVRNLPGATILGKRHGVDVSGGPGSVVNAGSITAGKGIGVEMDSGGSIHNLAGGSISGGTPNRGFAGLVVYGGAGAVTNAGVIKGTTEGIYLNQGGGVNNLSSGSITGDVNGVEMKAGPGSVVNAGSITSSGLGAFSYGVYLRQGGTVNNLSGGAITGLGNSGVAVAGGAGSVTNAGLITGTRDSGVSMRAGGIVANETNGVIAGNKSGVGIAGNGEVENSGTISGSGISGIEITGDGILNNQESGVIAGYTNGVSLSGKGSLINAGSITGTNNNGVYFGNGGSVHNLPGGRITGNGNDGLAIYGAAGYVTNAGSIAGEGKAVFHFATGSGDGVYLSQGGGVNNLPGGTITGKIDGVDVDGAPGLVVNAGTITGSRKSGVILLAGGDVTNLLGGLISGEGANGNGVEIHGGGSVNNLSGGTIDGHYSNGVLIDGGGNVNNMAGGVILSDYGFAGVATSGGPGYVTNAGSITGKVNSYGVYLQNGGSLNNLPGGTISGYTAGVEVSGSRGSVTNAGSIMGGGDGIFMVSEGSSVVNSGLVVGTNGVGVVVNSGGTVTNLAGGTISGDDAGVDAYGGPISLYNAGRITSASGTAISTGSGSVSNAVILNTGSEIEGNIVGDDGVDAAYLQGSGQFDDNFTNFDTLSMEADSQVANWNLTGTNTFTQSVAVQSGLLRINGRLDTPLVSIQSLSGGLGGAGVVNGTVDSHGSFSPGHSLGTLTINGSLTNWGNFYADVAASGGADRIVVNGAATINGGDVVALPEREVYGADTVYTILTATNGISGAYSGSHIQQPSSTNAALFLTGSLSNDLNNVYLRLHRLPFNDVARTSNQNAVARTLDGIVDSPIAGMSNLVSEMFWMPSAAAARQALDSLNGGIHGTLGMLDVRQQDAFNNSIAQHTGRISAGGRSGGFAAHLKPLQLASAGSALPPEQQKGASQSLGAWVQGIGSFGHLDGDGNAAGGNFTQSGLCGGIDYSVSPKWLVGLGVGYTRDNADVGGPGANGEVDAYQIGGYSGYVRGPWHLDGILSYGLLQTDTKRWISVGSIRQQAKGSYDGGVFSLSIEGGYAFEFNWLTVEPSLGLDYARLWQNRFSETGAASNGNNYGLQVNKVSMDSVRTSLGVRLGAQFGRPGRLRYRPALHALWEHEFADQTADVNTRFVGGGGDFIVRGVEIGADSAALGCGLTVAFNNTVQAFVNYEANLNSKISFSTVSGGLSLSY